MKKLLNTLYINNTDYYLSLEGEDIVINISDNNYKKLPLHNFEMICTCGYNGISPKLMGACVEKNITICYFDEHGKFLARVTGEKYGNVILRKEQCLISENKERCLEISKNFIIGKVYNSRWQIERWTRDYEMRIDVAKFKNISKSMYDILKSIDKCDDIDILRGLEGKAADLYFSLFDDFILQQKDDFKFVNRNRRPPLDNVNALLSFSYSLLTAMCVSALEMVGLDPYIGFMHTDRPGRKSLALDLVEELRSVYADRFVLTLINKKLITNDDFIKMEDGAVLLKDDSRKEFFVHWQKKKMEEITHPFLEEKVEWGMVPYVQALLLARYLRGDLEMYPTFLWK